MWVLGSFVFAVIFLSSPYYSTGQPGMVTLANCTNMSISEGCLWTPSWDITLKQQQCFYCYGFKNHSVHLYYDIDGPSGAPFNIFTFNSFDQFDLWNSNQPNIPYNSPVINHTGTKTLAEGIKEQDYLIFMLYTYATSNKNLTINVQIELHWTTHIVYTFLIGITPVLILCVMLCFSLRK
eukprot:TRINITY_DN12319_c0_g1_i1.p1 TRINITY_DN12319_c0_g1~~TRINITY_DN12319_c0_g1_i1.p1  ORF type:complete len:180 (-),score=13.55 TRINITY_DN12319_c0_g1_i1:76-615(-)